MKSDRLPDLTSLHINLYYAFLTYYLTGHYLIEVGEVTHHRLEYERMHIFWIPTVEPENTVWIISSFWKVNRCLPWNGWRVWKLSQEKA